MRFFLFMAVMLAALLARPASADSTLSEETDAGSRIFTQNVSADGDIGGNKDKAGPWDWNLGYTFTRTATPNAGSSDIVDQTNDVTGGGGWTGDNGFGIELAIDSATTPSEGLFNRGVTLTPSYKWDYGRKAKGSDDFAPSLTFKLNLGSTDYVQSFSGTITRRSGIVRPTSGTAQIRGAETGFELLWKPLEDWKFDFSVDPYSYNRNVAKFQSTLDSFASIATGLGGLSDTVGGLPRVIYGAEVTWYFVEKWKLVVSESLAKAAADGSTSNEFKTTAVYHFAKAWRVTAGLESETSLDIKDRLAILGLSMDI